VCGWVEFCLFSNCLYRKVYISVRCLFVVLLEVSFDKKLAFYLCFEVLSLVKHCNSSMNNIMQYV
jgi:hypothetical protein